MIYWIKKFIDLILYGNFWIALGALAMAFQTQLIIDGSFEFDSLTYFIFFSTLFLYAVHRIVGISKLHEYFELERYSVITHYKSHIRIYALVGFLASAYFFFFLHRNIQLVIVIPALLSLGYAIPFLSGKRKRLRDFDNVKIFLVAGVWAMVTVTFPVVEAFSISWESFILLFLERAVFVFAITLPFDIRDLKVDKHSSVKTIPGMLGEEKTRNLALILLGTTFALSLGNFILGFYPAPILLGITLSLLLTAGLIKYASVDKHDYFYSGLMDGTMVFQFLLVWACVLLWV